MRQRSARLDGVQLTFDPEGGDDEGQFRRTSKRLIGEMREWVAARFEDHGERAASAETFLSWRYGYSNGDLADFQRADIAEFLLEWCPRKVSARPEAAYDFCDGVSAFIEFMFLTDRLVGGAGRAAELMAFVVETRDDAYAAMGDRSKFGMAKSLFATPLTGSDGSPLADLFSLPSLDDLTESDLRALMQQRMDAFNALPFDQRKAVTDPSFARPSPPRVELDFVHFAPSIGDVERSASESRLVTAVHGLVDAFGTRGMVVTDSGNFKLADARRLVDLLSTGDTVDPVRGSTAHTTRSSRELRWLSLVADVAEEARAYEWIKNRFVANPEWSALPFVERASSIVDGLLAVGPLGSRGAPERFFGELRELLDDGVPHWMVGVLPRDERRDLDDVVEFARLVADERFPGYRARWSDASWNDVIESEIQDLFHVLEFAGIVELADREITLGRYGVPERHGGSFSLTPLGHHTMPSYARDAGYVFAAIGDLSTAAAIAVVDAFRVGDLPEADVLAMWWADRSTSERAEALGSVAAEANNPGVRLGALALLDALGDHGAVEPVVRQLLDSPASGHAALFLLSHGLATDEEVGMFLSIGPLVDILATLLDDPQELALMFSEAQERADGDLIDDMWRHDLPETALVLDALGRHLPDKKRAKAARKAAMQHRSWRANLHR